MRIARLLCLTVALILIPFALWEAPLSAFSEGVMRASRAPLQTATVVTLLLALDCLLPIPSSVVSLAAGASLGFWLGCLAIWSGMMGGSLLGYAVGRWGREFAARRMVTQSDIDHMQRWYAKGGVWFLVWSRPVPVLAETVIVFAGLSGVPMARFVIASCAVNLTVSVAYAAAGTWAQQQTLASIRQWW